MSIRTLDDYLLLIDESGDHVLDKVDREYPLFVLLENLVRRGL